MSTQTEVISVPSTYGVTTRQRLTYHESGSENLLIQLPGRGYTTDYPVLYHLRIAAVQRGYDVLSVEYGFQAAHADFDPTHTPQLVEDVSRVIQTVRHRGYRRVCIAGKSLGTPLAVDAASAFTGLSRSLILLTPVGSSVQNTAGIPTLAIIGTADPLYAPEEIAAYEGHPTLRWGVFEGLNHALEHRDDWQASLAVLPEIINLCLDYL
ncbi:MAG: hypothetical protein JNJ78_06650 [Anaerolineae bacterium]|nr:hypothetical protein [Anaerolineae bacterium]